MARLLNEKDVESGAAVSEQALARHGRLTEALYLALDLPLSPRQRESIGWYLQKMEQASGPEQQKTESDNTERFLTWLQVQAIDLFAVTLEENLVWRPEKEKALADKLDALEKFNGKIIHADPDIELSWK